ncbi:hypothetical protein KUTeg_011555 [Tegillarca granosa]|uniref:Uncharacterized protein n=1 Tax=Tegillarca granosa TaxID=220873 RepID=A0ABQ9F277_TEGGR|nr:hypothetical protein KUTeg_011555 [Tegillarca granosa]
MVYCAFADFSLVMQYSVAAQVNVLVEKRDFSRASVGSPLAVLSTAAEIKELQEKLKASEENLHHQKVLNQHLCLENSVLSKNKPIENNVDFLPLTVETVLKQELKFKGLFEYYCSLKYETYVKLLQVLTSETVPKIQI